MEKEIELVATMTVLSSLTANESLPQQEIVWKGGGEWGPGTPYARMYNPQTMESITGEVKKDNEVLTLRDASGFLVWSGWRSGEHS